LSLSVKGKLFASFAIVVLLTLVLGIVAVTMLGSVNTAAVQIGRDGVGAETSLATVGQVMNKLRKDQLHYFLVAPASRADVKRDIDGDVADMAGTFKAYRGSTRAEQRGFRRFQSAWNAYTTASTGMFALVQKGDTPAAETLIGDGGAADVRWDPVKATLASWQKSITTAVGTELHDARATYSTARIVVLFLVAFAALCGATVALVIGRSLTRGIAQLLRAADVSPRVTSSRPWTSAAATSSAGWASRS
jgi:hypothetical protein